MRPGSDAQVSLTLLNGFKRKGERLGGWPRFSPLTQGLTGNVNSVRILFMRIGVRRTTLLVRFLAVVVGGFRMGLGLIMLALRMVMGGLKVVVGGGLMRGGGAGMMVSGRMLR